MNGDGGVNDAMIDRAGTASAGPWVLFLIDQCWVAVEMERVSAVFDSSSVELSSRNSGGAFEQAGREGVVWLCDADLRAEKGEPREKILWFSDDKGAFALFCDAADDVAAGALVSTHELPPILRDRGGILRGLLVPDKGRIATLCDVDRLAACLAREQEAGEHG